MNPTPTPPRENNVERFSQSYSCARSLQQDAARSSREGFVFKDISLVLQRLQIHSGLEDKITHQQLVPVITKREREVLRRVEVLQDF